MAEMSILFPLLLLMLVSIAAAVDLHRRVIPNWNVVATTLLGAVALIASDPSAFWMHLAIALAVLASGIAVWGLGWLGGGDVKLIAALALWAGPDQVAGLLLTIALSGGALALLVMMRARIVQMPLFVVAQAQAARLAPAALRLPAWPSANAARSLPYGVAVACGGAWLAYHLAFA